MQYTALKFFSFCVMMSLVSYVQGESSVNAEVIASEYIVEKLLPMHPVLASRLLTVLMQSSPTSTKIGQHKKMKTNLFGGLRSRRPPVKRGMGQCIHNCTNSGSLNFIQCKLMCH